MSRRGSKTGNFSSRVSHKYSVTVTIDRLKSKWTKLEGIIEKNDKYLINLKEQIVYLKEKINRIPSIQKRNEILGWIAEKEQKIIDVKITSLNIKKSIEEIKSKIIYYKNI